MTKSDNTGPTGVKERFVFLDALRGFALLGIALANFPEFGLWTFLTADSQAAMPTATADRLVRFLQYALVDGKFYTIFSLLFGAGFSLFLSRHSSSRFLLRMLILLGIGLLHLLFLWNGDILSLYAAGGILLVCFIRIPERRLIQIALLLILLPVALGQWQRPRELTKGTSPHGCAMPTATRRCTNSSSKVPGNDFGSSQRDTDCPKCLACSSWDTS